MLKDSWVSVAEFVAVACGTMPSVVDVLRLPISVDVTKRLSSCIVHVSQNSVVEHK